MDKEMYRANWRIKTGALKIAVIAAELEYSWKEI